MADTGKDEKLYVRAFWEIRGYIMENHLRPGDLLPAEERLCARPGMKESQTPWKLTLCQAGYADALRLRQTDSYEEL